MDSQELVFKSNIRLKAQIAKIRGLRAEGEKERHTERMGSKSVFTLIKTILQ